MNNFKNNHRRPRFRSNSDRNYRKRNGNGHKVNGNFNNNPEFKRRNPGKNNQNAGKLIEKYNDLAREALSNGDKILSENYLQHADHFSRIINSQQVEKTPTANLQKVKEISDDKNKENKQINEDNKSNEINISD
tara:strand:+ start:763 stop:1164 length:402 start_codon:yes stop_codon:yes gene_type:complete